MSELPWRSDLEVTQEMIEGALRSVLADELKEFKYLGEGWDSRTYEVNGQYIFRFPKRKEVQVRIWGEICHLPNLSKALPVQVPQFKFADNRLEAYPYLYVGYPKLKGTPADRFPADKVDWKASAVTLARFFSALHYVRFTDLPELTIADPVNIPKRLAQNRDHAEIMAGMNRTDLRDKALAYLKTITPLALRFRPERRAVPIHNDVWPEHILVDDSGNVSGVLDWSDMVYGDPAKDFAGTFYWGGPKFYQDVVALYQRSLDEGAPTRARYESISTALVNIWYGKSMKDQNRIDGALRCLELNL